MSQNNANVRAFDTTFHDNSTTRKAEDFQINQTDIDPWCHSHQFDEVHEKSERRSLQVLLLTAVTMVVEIICGTLFGSMALLADGWHMATHVAAFMITIFAYQYAKKNADHPAFTFGTGKVSVLGGYTSAVVLVVVALMMAMESVERMMAPREIFFNEAIGVAIVGLLVNIASAFLLKDHHGHHHHHHGHDHPHDHEKKSHSHCDTDASHTHHDEALSHKDHNLKAAYFHVLADALTSVCAIVALIAGKVWGWTLLDPVMGIVGAVVITHWALGLIKETSGILLDRNSEAEMASALRSIIESDPSNRIVDLHLWKVGPEAHAAIVSILTPHPRPAAEYRSQLDDLSNLSHVTIEVNSP